MNADGFIRWALDDARTVDERYTVELLVELGVGWWNSRHNISKGESFEERMERKRQRALNPAYEPRYSQTDLQHATETWPDVKTWWFSPGYEERAIRDLTAFAFFTHLEEIHLHNCEALDVGVFAGLPNLRVLKFSSSKCEDLRPLAGNLLVFPPGVAWPNVRQATLKCEPLAARCVRDLPQLPACEFLTLG